MIPFGEFLVFMYRIQEGDFCLLENGTSLIEFEREFLVRIAYYGDTEQVSEIILMNII